MRFNPKARLDQSQVKRAIAPQVTFYGVSKKATRKYGLKGYSVTTPYKSSRNSAAQARLHRLVQERKLK